MATLDETAEKAISDVFADTSVGKRQTVNRLESLREHIDSLIEAVETDIRMEERNAENDT